LHLPTWGGKRPGAGRRPKGSRPLVSHKTRPQFQKAAALHVTLRVAEHVWNLRSRRCFRLIEACLSDARGRFGLRVIEFTVLGNHLHLLVEADSSASLSRGMQGLNIRVAKALNRLMRERGRVLADHYQARVLQNPTELVNALAYVLGNAAHHYGGAQRGEYSSAACGRARTLAHPRTWLLRAGWRRARRKRPWLKPPASLARRQRDTRA